jgi:hypothetical protein
MPLLASEEAIIILTTRGGITVTTITGMDSITPTPITTHGGTITIITLIGIITPTPIDARRMRGSHPNPPQSRSHTPSTPCALAPSSGDRPVILGTARAMHQPQLPPRP